MTHVAGSAFFSRPLPPSLHSPLSADNPRRSIWTVESTAAKAEKDAMRHSMMNAPEIWRFVNPSLTGASGGPVGYPLEGHNAMTLLAPDDCMQKRDRLHRSHVMGHPV